MNGEQQRERATAIMALEGKFKEFTEVVEAAYLQEEKERKFDDEAIRHTANDNLNYCRNLVNEEHTHRLKLAEEQRYYVDATDMSLARCIDRVEKLNLLHFWGRIWWMLTGNIK